MTHCDAVKELQMVAKINEIGIRVRHPLAIRCDGFQRDQAVRFGHASQRLKKYSVDPGEDGCAGRDSYGQREYCHRGNSWIAPHHAEPESHILPNRFQPLHPMPKSEAFPRGGHISKNHSRPPFGFRTGKPLGFELIGFHLQVRADLFGKIVSAATVGKHLGLLARQRKNEVHGPGKATPLVGLVIQFRTALGRQRVEPSFAIVLRGPPLGRDHAAVFEPLQREIKRSMIDEEDLLRLPLDASGNSLSMASAK